jgi:hypothetical protein
VLELYENILFYSIDSNMKHTLALAATALLLDATVASPIIEARQGVSVRRILHKSAILT